jgi:hypothetical protein
VSLPSGHRRSIIGWEEAVRRVMSRWEDPIGIRPVVCRATESGE